MRTSIAVLLTTLLIIGATVARRRRPEARRLQAVLGVAALAVALWALWGALADHGQP